MLTNNELHKIPSMLPIGILILNADGQVQYWNQWLAEKTKISPANAENKTLQELYPDFKNPRFDWAIKQVAQNKYPQILTHTLHKYLIPIKTLYRHTDDSMLMRQNVYLNPLIDETSHTTLIIVSIIDVSNTVEHSSKILASAQDLEIKSYTDSLTRIYNRHYLDLWLTQQLKMTTTNSLPLSLLLFDIDHFKEINDQNGHDIGDQVLVDFSQFLLSCMRQSDVLIRYGGDEIIALLPKAKLDNAVKKAENIRQRLSKLSLGVQPAGTVTCSIGISYNDKTTAKNLAKLIQSADKQLYLAKNSGRNCVYPKPLD
ncbi:MAG: GGDEF domain-containing protein [Gammaproteobacteria bacterium]|nr:GGDEF domain-containing protein [Gammaproteobacteria bacterium]